MLESLQVFLPTVRVAVYFSLTLAQAITGHTTRHDTQSCKNQNLGCRQGYIEEKG